MLVELAKKILNIYHAQIGCFIKFSLLIGFFQEIDFGFTVLE